VGRSAIYKARDGIFSEVGVVAQLNGPVPLSWNHRQRQADLCGYNMIVSRRGRRVYGILLTAACGRNDIQVA